MTYKLYYIGVLSFLLLMAGCRNRDAIVDRGKLLARDYRLFQQTPLWPLAKAVEGENPKDINKIASQDGIDINYQEAKYGKTLLMLAVLNEQYQSLKALLEVGANPNIHDSYSGSSAIIEAANIGGITTDGTKFLKLLLAHGANPNDEEVGKRPEGNSTRLTPLLVACGTSDRLSHSIERVKVLVEAGADINHRNEYGQSPLGAAVIQDNLEVVLYLLNKGCDFKTPVFYRDSIPLFLWNVMRESIYPLDSKEYGRKMHIVGFLHSKGVDYRKMPIPEWVVREAKETYPKNWKEYLEKY